MPSTAVSLAPNGMSACATVWCRQAFGNPSALRSTQTR